MTIKRKRLIGWVTAFFIILVGIVIYTFTGQEELSAAEEQTIGAAPEEAAQSAADPAMSIEEFIESGSVDVSNVAESVEGEPEVIDITEVGEAENNLGSQPNDLGLALPAPSWYPITAVTEVAENERFKLLIDEKTGNIRVIDKETEKEWLGAPQLTRDAMPNEKKYVDSPIFIRYTEGSDIVSTYTLKEKDTTVTINQAENGTVRVDFELVSVLLSFAMEYQLTDQGLQVTIPYDSLQEKGTAKFVSLEPLPFLNAARESDDGAIFIPDGSGALIHYREKHPQYLKGYSEQVYGPDYDFVTQSHDVVMEGWQRVLPNKQYAALPVFGLYRNGIGVTGVITKGQYNAKINATPAGIRSINLYRTSAELLYRHQDVIFVGASGQIPYFQGRMIEGDRTVEYILLQEEEASYVGMAKAYRDYLISEQGVTPVDAKPELQISMLGGIVKDELIGSTFIRMTTFEQAREVMDELLLRGMNQLRFTMNGWSKGGLYGNQPDHFPVARQLGGSSELKKLIAYAADQGFPVDLSANYVRPAEESNGAKKNKDAIRGLDREVVKVTDYYVADRWNNNRNSYFLMKPTHVLEQHLVKELSEYRDYGVNGIHLQYMGDSLYSDQDSKGRIDRSETANIWIQSLDQVREATGSAAVDYGFAYSFGHVDHIHGAPLSSSGFVIVDESIPFYQLVVHGLIPYSAEPINLVDDGQVAMLKSLEYGALPSLELTYLPSNELQLTKETRLFSSYYKDWLDTAKEQYSLLPLVYDKIAGQQMVNHELVQSGVYRTTYENGIQVLINYNSKAVVVDGMNIPSAGYAVKGG